MHFHALAIDKADVWGPKFWQFVSTQRQIAEAVIFSVEPQPLITPYLGKPDVGREAGAEFGDLCDGLNGHLHSDVDRGRRREIVFVVIVVVK